MNSGPISYPRNHEPGMRVPAGGSSCSSCEYVSGDMKHCTNKYFIRWHGGNVLPARADSFCSDWYIPKQGAI